MHYPLRWTFFPHCIHTCPSSSRASHKSCR